MDRMTYRDSTIWAHAEKDCRIFKDTDEYGNECFSGELINRLADYEDAEERLQEHFGANITLTDMLNHFVMCIEDKEGSALNGFRVLTNEDAESYDKWKVNSDYWEREAKKWCDKLFDIKLMMARSENLSSCIENGESL